MTRAIKVRSESTRRIPVMFGLPLLAGVVGLAFGAVVLKQYSERRRPYQAAWGAALLCFGAAALWEAAGIFGGWTPVLYKGYYLLGGILNVGWLGVGSLYVLAPRRWGHIGALVMALITVLAVPAVVLSPTDAHLLTAGHQLDRLSDPDRRRRLGRLPQLSQPCRRQPGGGPGADRRRRLGGGRNPHAGAGP